MLHNKSGKSIKKQPIKTGKTNEEYAEILEGLSENDKIQPIDFEEIGKN
jgi:hypothetical protein